MSERSESILENIRNIQSLRNLLKTEMSISEPVDGEVIASIKVYNDAPESLEGSNIVFIGIGLRFIHGKEEGRQRDSNYWPNRITTSRLSDIIKLRRVYEEGYWFGSRGNNNSFPVATPDEQSHGEILFPGEAVVYDIKIPEVDLPYLDIRVKGSRTYESTSPRASSVYNTPNRYPFCLVIK